MKKVLLLFVSLFVLGQIAFAHYNHSIITSNGQTLYFMVYSDFHRTCYYASCRRKDTCSNAAARIRRYYFAYNNLAELK